MKIALWCIGKSPAGWQRDSVIHFLTKLNHYYPTEYLELPDPKKGKGNPEELKKEEAQLFISKLNPNDVLILLDEKGLHTDSRGFAKWFQKKLNASPTRLVFLIGGPFGFDESIYARANDKVSLSPMTLNHELIRPVFLEQLYRAATILKGEKYHHD
jgi:23S rRNA (pseudouridine1915-N3)-methyltransferase